MFGLDSYTLTLSQQNRIIITLLTSVHIIVRLNKHSRRSRRLEIAEAKVVSIYLFVAVGFMQRMSAFGRVI